MKTHRLPRALTLLVLFSALFVPAQVFAHPGHDGVAGVSQGLVHPISGWDHLLAMLAVGLWAAQLGGRARWSIPMAFVLAMGLGGWLGLSRFDWPAVEQGILLSVLLLGLLVAMAVRMPLVPAGCLVASFALLHGYAHGVEIPATASVGGYALGFLAGTALLHLLGFALATGLIQARQIHWVKKTGWAICAGGLLLLSAL